MSITPAVTRPYGPRGLLGVQSDFVHHEMLRAETATMTKGSDVLFSPSIVSSALHEIGRLKIANFVMTTLDTSQRLILITRTTDPRGSYNGRTPRDASSNSLDCTS